MPDSPDFEQIAARMAQGTVVNKGGGSDDLSLAIQKFAEQLREVWNARGAADIATLKASGGTTMMQGSSYQELKALDTTLRAIRSLDR